MMEFERDESKSKANFKKKAISKKLSEEEDMKEEYDFSSMKGAIRGKYYKAYRKGHKVVILVHKYN